MVSVAWATDVRVILVRAVLVTAVVVGAVHCDPEPAAAQCAPHIVEDRRVLLSRAGVPGVWFHLDVADCLLTDLAELQELRAQVHLLDEALTLRVEQEADLRAALTALMGERDAAVGALTAADRARRAAEEDRDHWSRSPALWTVVGAVLGLTAAAVAVQALGG